MKIFNQYKRPVLNRTEKDKNPYSEIIFHLKENKIMYKSQKQNIEETIINCLRNKLKIINQKYW